MRFFDYTKHTLRIEIDKFDNTIAVANNKIQIVIQKLNRLNRNFALLILLIKRNISKHFLLLKVIDHECSTRLASDDNWLEFMGSNAKYIAILIKGSLELLDTFSSDSIKKDNLWIIVSNSTEVAICEKPWAAICLFEMLVLFKLQFFYWFYIFQI